MRTSVRALTLFMTKLLQAFCNIFQKHASLFEELDGEYSIPLVTHARSVREFDQGLTSGVEAVINDGNESSQLEQAVTNGAQGLAAIEQPSRLRL